MFISFNFFHGNVTVLDRLRSIEKLAHKFECYDHCDRYFTGVVHCVTLLCCRVHRVHSFYNGTYISTPSLVYLGPTPCDNILLTGPMNIFLLQSLYYPGLVHSGDTAENESSSSHVFSEDTARHCTELNPKLP